MPVETAQPSGSIHEHRYIFLRQQMRPTRQRDGRVLERVVEDVFFCEICLSYSVVQVRREELDHRHLGWVEIR